MEKLIFLDIDGVLNSLSFFKSRAYQKSKNNHDMSSMINHYNLFWVSLLCRITKSKVVLSSTWKFGWNEDGSVKTVKGHNMHKTNELFKKHGINIISKTSVGELGLLGKWEMDEDAIKAWCNQVKAPGLESCSQRDWVLKYCRGTQIADWIENNHYNGKYIIIDDDYQDIVFYKDFAKRIVTTSYYGTFGGFGFRHFIKGLYLLWKRKY